MTEKQGLRLFRLALDLKEIAGQIGPLHAYWDVILDIDAFIKGKPTLMQHTAEEWIECAEKLLSESRDGNPIGNN